MSDQQGQTPEWPPQQSFQQSPYVQQSSLYTQPTQASPGQFQQPPYNNFPPPRKRPGLWRWYKTRTRRMKISLGCATLLAILLFFLGIGAAVGSNSIVTPSSTTSPSHQVVATDATPTLPQVIQQPTATPTPQPHPTLTPTLKPQPTISKPTPTPVRPTPTPTPCPGVNCNPWGYNFSSPGNLIYYPPANFCSYFSCITSFQEPDDPGDGYIVQCADNLFSQSGGERGACSYHGGVSRPLYSH